MRVAEDSDAEIAGTLHVFIWNSPKPHFWAPMQEQWTVKFNFTMLDGSTPTPAQSANLGTDIANSRRYPKGLHRSLFESGGGTAVEPLTAGLLHNTAAASAALLALVSIRGTVHAYTRQRRIARQLCAECAYSRKGLSRETPCPECAWIPGNQRQG